MNYVTCRCDPSELGSLQKTFWINVLAVPRVGDYIYKRHVAGRFKVISVSFTDEAEDVDLEVKAV